jgi:predicted RNA methylase
MDVVLQRFDLRGACVVDVGAGTGRSTLALSDRYLVEELGFSCFDFDSVQ